MYQIYQLNVGETLESVAQKLGVDISELRRLNGISDNAIVSTGSYIVIPKEVNNNYKKYIVKKGDTIYGIARNNNIDYNTLLAVNGLNPNDYIYPEQELLIPSRNMYVTKENDRVKDVVEKLNLDFDKFGDLYLMQDQTIYY